MNLFLTVLQALMLIVIGALLWQIWQYLNRKDVSEDEPLGEERAKYLTMRLTIIQILVIAEAVVFVSHTILRVIEQVN